MKNRLLPIMSFRGGKILKNTKVQTKQKKVCSKEKKSDAHYIYIIYVHNNY